jgi:hypothetical protein
LDFFYTIAELRYKEKMTEKLCSGSKARPKVNYQKRHTIPGPTLMQGWANKGSKL